MTYLINVSNIAQVLFDSESIQLFDNNENAIVDNETLAENIKNHSVFVYGDESTVKDITQ